GQRPSLARPPNVWQPPGGRNRHSTDYPNGQSKRAAWLPPLLTLPGSWRYNPNNKIFVQPCRYLCQKRTLSGVSSLSRNPITARLPKCSLTDQTPTYANHFCGSGSQ